MGLRAVGLIKISAIYIMSSLQKSYSQIAPRSKFLFSISSDSGFTQLKLNNAVDANPGLVLGNNGTVLNTTDASAFIGAIGYGRSYRQGVMFRDLGKTLHVQTKGRTDYIMTYVQEVRGFKSEGVPNNFGVSSTSTGNFWICTWNGDNSSNDTGISVNVVRA